MKYDDDRIRAIAASLAYGCMEAALYIDSECPMRGAGCPLGGGCFNITADDWLDWMRGENGSGQSEGTA